MKRIIEEKYNSIIHGDNVEVLKSFPDCCIDLTVTSPPYDDMRSYKGLIDSKSDFNGYSFDFEALAPELYRVTKDGGVLVWVVDHATVDGDETCNSFRQALFFRECGFKLHDTMIYEKNGISHPSSNRYHQVFEYMFVLSKGTPKSINIIKDRKNLWAGSTNWGKVNKHRGKNDEFVEQPKKITADYGARFNIWRFKTGGGFSAKDEIAFEHPAIFPEELARDHIKSWSNINDIVLDPFSGSGTTAKMAAMTGRKYIGVEINQEYVDLSQTRIIDYGHNTTNEFIKF